MSTSPTILIVEDETSIRDFLDDFLSDEGYTVTVVGEGWEALAHIANQSFDLALIDLVLPDIAGLDIIHACHQKSPKTIIIALTGWPFSEAELARLEPHVYDYLTKPFPLTILKKVIQEALRDR